MLVDDRLYLRYVCAMPPLYLPYIWKVVLVDDRLPCGADGKPCYAHNPSPSVFWAAIVEKGLAKLFGSYAATEAPPTPQGQLQVLDPLANPEPTPLPPQP